MMKEPSHYKDWPNEAAFNASANHHDVREPISLPITGSFPEYAAGVLFRTGPGLYKTPCKASKGGSFNIRHWFDGFTTLHRFELVSGQSGDCSDVLYSSKIQVEELLETAQKTGNLKDHVSFGERDPCESIYRKVKSTFCPAPKAGGPSRANIGVALRRPLPAEAAMPSCAKHTSRDLLTVTTDNSSVKHFDAVTLEPLDVSHQDTIHPDLTGPLSAAHACEDPVTGDIFNYNLLLGPTHVYKVFRASPDGSVQILAEVKGSDVRGAYLHSLFLTDNFVILCVWPAYYTYMGLSILYNRNLLDSIHYDPKGSTKWFVIDRKSDRGLIQTFTSPAFFSFHTVNAWEEQSENSNSVDVVCELVEFADAQILEMLQYKYIVSTEAVSSRTDGLRKSKANLARYRLEGIGLRTEEKPRVKVSVEAKKIHSFSSGDLPRINGNFALKPHRYVYSMLDRGNSSFIDGIGKTDTMSGETIVWEQAKHTPGEPIFVARPGAEEEDDGVILSVVFNGESSTSYLVCLAARDLTEVARAEAPGPIGLGFHGLHVPKATPNKVK